MQLVECVPNFSEGRDKNKIDQITNEIQSVSGVKLLHIDPGRDTNRTVVTFVGPPVDAAEAAFRAIARAAQVIDMSQHQGAHPRMGATDVCPFIPIRDTTMAECADLAHGLGKRVGEELGIPVYLYEEAASSPQRKNLADIRSGEYEGLSAKIADPEWKPDFGPAEFNPRSGATVIGAREFLIAYNVNLNTRDKRIANEIAASIRETGRPKKDNDGNILRDAAGEALRIPGKFSACKAVGWYMPDFGRAQISINLVNYKMTPVHEVFDECCRLAESLGARVTGSELVGLIPLQAMLQAGRYYLKKMGKSSGVPESELVHTAILSLGLDDLAPFDPRQKIIEYQIDPNAPLMAMSLRQFTDLLSTDAPAPGGGSVAALCGAMSAALSSMVAALTFGRKGYENASDAMEQVGVQAQCLKDELMSDVDRDTAAFNKVMDAMRLPKKTEEEKLRREAAMEAANKGATLVPLAVMQRAQRAAELAGRVAQQGFKNSLSDAAVAAITARAAAEGAYLNVLINLSGIQDDDFKSHVAQESKDLYYNVMNQAEKIFQTVQQELLRT
jgi:glutamate formiminotransferase / formiminotetrahydrofolate cyclodeaminase